MCGRVCPCSAGCPVNFILVENSCYGLFGRTNDNTSVFYRNHLVPRDWDSAKLSCEELGWRLAKIPSQSVYDTLKDEFGGLGSSCTFHFLPWFGLSSPNRNRNYVFLDGSPFRDTVSWRRPNPDGVGQENCIQMTCWGLNDNYCGYRFEYICEVSPGIVYFKFCARNVPC